MEGNPLVGKDEQIRNIKEIIEEAQNRLKTPRDSIHEKTLLDLIARKREELKALGK